MKMTKEKARTFVKKYTHIRPRWKIIGVLLVLFLALDYALYIGIQQYYPDVWKKKPSLHTTATPSREQKAISTALKNSTLNSPYAIVVDMQDGRTLYDKNGDQRIYPASLTKVLTALTAIDATNDLQKNATVTTGDLAHLKEEDASVAGLQPNDTLSYEQAIYAMILPSGADAANFLANHLAGNVPNFVSLMNKKASTIGMTHSHFTNTSGLHNNDLYTTLQDLKKLMIHAWNNPVLHNVLTTTQYTIANLASHPDGLHLHSTLVSYGHSLTFKGGAIVGGKSGYTPEAGCCLLSFAKMDNGHIYMLITAKAGGTPYDHLHINDALSVYKTIAATQHL